MAGASRLLRATRALQSDNLHSNTSTSSSTCFHFLPLSFCGKKRVAVSSDTTTFAAPEQTQKPSLERVESVELISSLSAKLAKLILGFVDQWRQANGSKYWRTYAEILVEKGIIGCQSFTLVGIAGSLIGSILCFIEGCFFVLESFLKYFQMMMSQSFDQGGIIKPVIEAIDMFLVGTAMLTFGMGLYVMFMGADNLKQKSWHNDNSDSDTFSLKKFAENMQMKTLTQAKSKLGHAILLILQAGVLDKFKNVPLTTGLDLACFGGAVFISSACVFLLSKLQCNSSIN